MEVFLLGLCALFYGAICMIIEDQNNDPVNTKMEWMNLWVRELLAHPQMTILLGIQLYLFYLTTAFFFVQTIFQPKNACYIRKPHSQGYWLALDAVSFEKY